MGYGSPFSCIYCTIDGRMHCGAPSRPVVIYHLRGHLCGDYDYEYEEAAGCESLSIALYGYNRTDTTRLRAYMSLSTSLYLKCLIIISPAM
jgi:hypothetical protein